MMSRAPSGEFEGVLQLTTDSFEALSRVTACGDLPICVRGDICVLWARAHRRAHADHPRVFAAAVLNTYAYAAPCSA